MKRIRLNKKVLVVMILIGNFMTLIGSWELILKTQAAELISITNLEVIVSPNSQGIAAKCSYQNYGALSGCEIRLYLYRQDVGGVSVIGQKIISYADYGSESTESVTVPEGIYFASITMDYGTELKQINSRSCYRVKCIDGNYIITEETNNKENVQKEDKHVQNVIACEHVMEYDLVQAATPISDGILAYQCMKCGIVFQYVEMPNSAYVAFLKETENAILNTTKSEVEVSTELWSSFNRDVFEAMRQRPDITVVVNYQYQRKLYQIKIPAGADVELFMDENGFCGFRHMEEVLAP